MLPRLGKRKKRKKNHILISKCVSLYVCLYLLKEIEEDRQRAQQSGQLTTSAVEYTKDTPSTTMRSVSREDC